MIEAVTLRAGQESDAQAIAELVHGVAHYFLANPSNEGAEAFLSSISQSAIVGYITSPTFNYIKAVVGSELTGVAALRDYTHVYHLYVGPGFHRQASATSCGCI
jgi:hypothetical protein